MVVLHTSSESPLARPPLPWKDHCFGFRSANQSTKQSLEISAVLSGRQLCQTIIQSPPKLTSFSLRASGKKGSKQSTCTRHFQNKTKLALTRLWFSHGDNYTALVVNLRPSCTPCFPHR